MAFGHVVHFGHHLILVHPRPDAARSGDVHVGSDVAGALYLGNLLCGLHVALCHDGADEGHGAFLMRRRHTQPVHQFQFVFGAVGRQVVYGTPLLHGTVQVVCQLDRRQCLRNAHGRSLLTQSGLGTHPDNVVNGKLIAEDDFPVLINVDNGVQSGKGKPEIVKERGVLTVTERVVLVIQTLFIVAQKQQHAAAHGFFQHIAALHVSVF